MAVDLNDLWGWVQKLVARVSRLESGAMLENSSITNGRMRFIGGLLRVDSGGRVEIVGTLEGEGPLGWVGLAAFDGPVEITDTLDVTASTRLRNTLDVTGPTTLNATVQLLKDMLVKAGGKIVIEGSPSIELSQAGGVATLAFGDGPRVYSQGTIVRMDAGPGTSRVSATPISAGMYAPNETSVTVSNSGAAVGGQLTVVGPLINSGITTNSGTANVMVDLTTKRLYVVSSATKYKTLIKEANIPPALLDVPVRDWVDIAEAQRAIELYEAPRPLAQDDQVEWDALRLRRIPGVIAEDVEAAGGRQFVTYGPNGDAESVAYDRLAIAQTRILRDEMRAEVAALRAEIAELREDRA